MAKKPPASRKKKGSKGRTPLKNRSEIEGIKADKKSPDFKVLKNVIMISFSKLIPCSIVKLEKFR